MRVEVGIGEVAQRYGGTRAEEIFDHIDSVRDDGNTKLAHYIVVALRRVIDTPVQNAPVEEVIPLVEEVTEIAADHIEVLAERVNGSLEASEESELTWPFADKIVELSTPGFVSRLSTDERILWGTIIDPTQPSIRQAVKELRDLGITKRSPEQLMNYLIAVAKRYLEGHNQPRIDGKIDDQQDDGWQKRGLCAQTDPEAFFPEKGGSTREAKKVCMSCEVRAQCLDHALMTDERFGVRGGLSERERRRLKKKAA